MPPCVAFVTAEYNAMLLSQVFSAAVKLSRIELRLLLVHNQDGVRSVQTHRDYRVLANFLNHPPIIIYCVLLTEYNI
jgi:hypothetical protein